MKYLVSVLMMFALAGYALAADKPNFSGNWKMNASKSDYGAIPAPESFTRQIDHKEPSIKIVEEQTGPNTTPTSTRAMTTDGKINQVDIGGAPVSLSATWEGNKLTAVTAIDSVGVKFKDTMSLSADGKQLTSNVAIESAQGNAEIKVVFDRQ